MHTPSNSDDPTSDNLLSVTVKLRTVVHCIRKLTLCLSNCNFHKARQIMEKTVLLFGETGMTGHHILT